MNTVRLHNSIRRIRHPLLVGHARAALKTIGLIVAAAYIAQSIVLTAASSSEYLKTHCVDKAAFVCTHASLLRLLIRDQAKNLLSAALLPLFFVDTAGGFKTLVIVHGTYLVLLALLGMPFFGDEPQHLAYVKTLWETGRIPLTTDLASADYALAVRQAMPPTLAFIEADLPFYEAIQPPLYYLLMGIAAALWGLMRHPAASFLTMRFVGAVVVTLSYSLTLAAFVGKKRKQTHVLLPNDVVLLAALCATYVAFAPGFVLQFSSVGNEQLSIFACALLFFNVYSHLPKSHWSRRQSLVLGLLGGLAWSAKLTYIFYVPVVVVLSYLRSNLKQAALTLGSALFIGLPWHFYNMASMGAFTGMRAHIKFVQPILNPDNIRFTRHSFWHNVVLRFFDTYGASPSLRPALDYVCAIFGAALALGTGAIVFQAVNLFVKRGWSGFREAHHADVLLGLFAAISLWGPITVALVPTLTYGINFALPRYTYPAIGGVAVVAAFGFACAIRRSMRVPLVISLVAYVMWDAVCALQDLIWSA